MPGKVVHFEIPADNVERAKTFYMKAFGWEINQYPGMQYHMVGTTPSNQQGMPTEPGAINGGLTKRQDPNKNIVIGIDVPDIEASLKNIEKLGGKNSPEEATCRGHGLHSLLQGLRRKHRRTLAKRPPHVNTNHCLSAPTIFSS